MNLLFSATGKRFKSIFTIILLNAVLVFSSCGKDNKTESQGNKTDTDKKDTVNESTGSKDPGSFIVSYDLQGMMDGKMEILRDGNTLKQIMSSNIMGMPNINTIYILDNNVYSITEAGGQKFATKTDLKEYNSRKVTGETITDFMEFEKFLSDKKLIGNENILGYNSDIYDVGNGMNLSVYDKKYILRIKSSDFMAVATKLDTKPS
ncbi:MAG: hypothetical protein M3P82_06185, partial [Bacteroidota bacterium]|nr:hypothetical protein [Bacteroidota bacterium]